MADIKVVGYTGEYLDNAVSCGKLDNFGRSVARMYWLDSEEWEEDGEYWPAQYGWWSSDGEIEYNNVKLSAGEGLWFAINDTSLSIQSAGQVATGVAIKLVKGNQLIANPLPVGLKMSQIYVTGYTGEYLDNGVSCGKLDNFGRSIARMYWLDSEEWEEDGEYWPAQYGWWSSDGETEYNNEDLAAGEALWFADAGTGFTLNFPNPLVK